MKYKKAEAEIIFFDNKDVIITSGFENCQNSINQFQANCTQAASDMEGWS